MSVKTITSSHAKIDSMTELITPAEENRLFEWFEATTGRAWDSLSEAESAVWKAYLFDLQVQNGGFEQALLNIGDHWQDLLVSLKSIGATKIDEMCQTAAAVFPGGFPPVAAETRHKQLWALGQEAKDLLWKLGGDYYDLHKTDPGEDMYSKMFACLKGEKVL